MALCRLAVFGAVLGAVIALGMGCSDTKVLDPDTVNNLQTLTVFYGDPGPNPDPCNDVLPVLDGVGQDAEWVFADPLLVRMTGENGNGGADFFLEVRAIWTDESKLDGTDRIYFLFRYQDNDQDRLPDQLAYAARNLRGQLIPSPTPADTVLCEPMLVSPANWTRLNPDGQEDQVMVMITRVDDNEIEAPTRLVEMNRMLIGQVGVDTPRNISGLPVHNVDVWIWRSGRTNLHPVPQFPNWEDVDGKDFVPALEYSRFEQNAGFAQDFWVNDAGTLNPDPGPVPFVRNYVDGSAVPINDHECPFGGKDPTDEDLEKVNRGIPNELGLWDKSSKRFRCENTLSCSRVGTPNEWNRGLPPGDYDSVQGWRLRVPYNPAFPSEVSARDVRARGVYENSQQKGFGTQTVEVMRQMNTGNLDDDLAVDARVEAGVYRMVIGILDASGRVGSGSSEIRLRFEAPVRRIGQVNRCN